MRKSLLILLSLIAVLNTAVAQVGIGTSTPNTHAVLDLRSPNNNQGLLIPSLTNAQRFASTLTSALTSQDNGLLVYDSDDKKFYFWKDIAWQPVLDGAVSGVGTVTNVGTGTGLIGGPITVNGTISLANTAVTNGTYGSATEVPQFTVDAQGRITSASNLAISGVPPAGAAGGDLGGTFPNPIIANLRGNALSATVPTANQVLKWNGSSWTPAADANSGGTVTSVTTGTGLAGGPITGAGTISLANTAVTPATYGDATHVSQVAVDAQGRITSASSVLITGAAPTGAAGGDLTGTYPNPTIAANAVTAAKIAAGDYSTKINAGTYSINISGNATTATNFSGALAGDVSGTQGATLVSKLQGNALSPIAPTANQILKWNGATWLPSADANSGGTVTSVATGTGLSGGPITGAGTITLANTAVTPATYGDATHVSQVAVDAQGRITNASSVLITGAAPTGAAGGDLTGNYPNPTISTNAVTAAKIAAGDYSTKINAGTYSINISGTAANFSGSLVGDVTGTQGTTLVSKLQGNALSPIAPTANQILKWNGATWLPSADANSGGTVTSVATGTGLSGGPIVGAGTISLANTAVTPATYGDATHVSQVAVDAQGRITNASSVLITGAAPTGAAGGDLTGNYPNPTISTNAVTAAKIAAGDYSTKINAGTYSINISGNATTATTATNFSGALAGDVTGTQGATLVSKLQGNALSPIAPTANQILKWNGATWLPSADANSGGTVTSVATGTGLSGGPIVGAGTISLANTTVTPATYGDATHVSQVAIDAQGRITNASSVLITGASPTGAAGGDLAGTYPNPTIAANAVTAAKIAAGDYSAKINAGTYSINISGNATTATTATNFSGALAGDVTGSQGATLVSKLQGNTLSPIAPTANQVLKWTGATWLPSADANSGGTVTSVATSARLTGGPITAAGTLDLAASGVTAATYGSGTQVAQVVVDTYGRITSASNVAITGAPPNGAAGGDLAGTYPNPTIASGAVTDVKIANGITASKVSPSGTNGFVLTTVAGATAWAALPAAGTVTSVATTARLTGGPITSSGTLDLAASGVTAATYGSGTQVAQVVVDTYGRVTSASNVAITGAPPTGAAGGDLTGTYPNPTIGTGKVTTTGLLDGTIADVDISAAAAIVDTKLATISTAGKVSGNAIITGTIAGNTIINTTGSITSSKSVSASNGIALPGSVITGTNAGTGRAVSGTSTNTGAGDGIYGEGTGVTVLRTTTYSNGVRGYNNFSGSWGVLGAQFGVYANSPNDWAIYSTGTYGLYALGTQIGVYASANGAGTYGVYGSSAGAGAYGIYSNGQAGGTTGWATVSDFRYKKNIHTLSNSLSKVMQLRGVTYDWRSEEFPKKHFGSSREIGVIAQEIREILPEVVVQDNDGYFAVSYEKIVPVLIEAIKEQQQLLNDQSQKIRDLEKSKTELEKLSARIAALEAAIQPRTESKSTDSGSGSGNR